jgi:DNA-binding NtrC family response regulator
MKHDLPDEEAMLELAAGSLDYATRQFQRRYIENAINVTQGNVTAAARLLGISRPNLYRAMRRLGMIDKEEQP